MMVLFYHRIADDHPNPWSMTNACFEQQIHWLKRNFELISLEEMQRRMRSGSSHRPAVCVTFDDGYADNCHAAIPLLIKEQIPCVYFVTVNNVETGEPFPHDAALGQILSPNTKEQLRSMAAAGIEIGCHTRTHCDLGRVHDAEKLHDEVVETKAQLAEWTGRPVRYFAFPFGQRVNLNADAVALAKKAGYEAVCSAYGGYNFPGDDPFHIQRIHGDPAFVRLRNDLTVDPRKLTRRYRIETIGRREQPSDHSPEVREPA